jgi:hypothetical protein
VDGKVFTEDKVEAIFYLAEGIETVQIHGLAFPFGELGAQKKGPIVEALLQDLWGQAVGGLLEGLGVAHGQKGIVFFTEWDAGLVQFGLQKVVSIDVIGGLKREKGGDSQDHGA